MSKPIVAIVGRPNVGKSTLFNQIGKQRVSIVDDMPGVTRDRIYLDAEWLGHEFTMIDTGGIELDESDHILKSMRQQAQIAMEEADVILFVVDGRTGLTTADEEVGHLLRSTKKPVVLAVNKVDSPEREMAFLTVHGMLHLLGYDHMEEADRLEMEKEQRYVMEQLGISRNEGA